MLTFHCLLLPSVLSVLKLLQSFLCGLIDSYLRTYIYLLQLLRYRMLLSYVILFWAVLNSIATEHPDWGLMCYYDYFFIFVLISFKTKRDSSTMPTVKFAVTHADIKEQCVYMTTLAMCMWVHVSSKNISVYVSITLRLHWVWQVHGTSVKSVLH